MKPKRAEFPDFSKIQNGWLLYLKNMPTVIGETAVNFFKDGFNRQGFIDRSFERWTPRKDKLVHKILMKSLYLQNSIKVVEANFKKIEIAPVTNTTFDYAKIHNEGGTVEVPITAKSRKFFWYMYAATKEQKWKNMALTKKTSFSFTMPKRQFIGSSEFLMKRITKNHEITVEKIMKQF